MAQLSRKAKELLLIEKGAELQFIWKKPAHIIPSDYEESLAKELTDEQLDEAIKTIVGQLRFEKTLRVFGWIFKTIVVAFVVLGIIGLLVFGIKQLF